MSYEKFLVDNPTCSRRFHLTFDSEAPKQNTVQIACPFCNVVIFDAKDHPEVHMIRQENLTQTQELSDRIVRDCRFEDTFGKQTIKPHTTDGCCP